MADDRNMLKNIDSGVSLQRLNDESRTSTLSSVSISLKRSISSLVSKSSSLLAAVGSQLGVSGSQLDLWREQVEKRAKNGEIGFPVAHILPKTSHERNRDEVIDNLQQTLSQLSVELEQDDLDSYEDLVVEALSTSHDSDLELAPFVTEAGEDTAGIVASQPDDDAAHTSYGSPEEIELAVYSMPGNSAAILESGSMHGNDQIQITAEKPSEKVVKPAKEMNLDGTVCELELEQGSLGLKQQSSLPSESDADYKLSDHTWEAVRSTVDMAQSSTDDDDDDLYSTARRASMFEYSPSRPPHSVVDMTARSVGTMKVIRKRTSAISFNPVVSVAEGIEKVATSVDEIKKSEVTKESSSGLTPTRSSIRSILKDRRSSSITDGEVAEHIEDIELLHGMVALKHYREYIKYESEQQLRELKVKRDLMRMHTEGQREHLLDSLAQAKDYFTEKPESDELWHEVSKHRQSQREDTDNGSKTRWPHKGTSNLQIPGQADRLSVYTPWLTWTLCLLQTGTFIGLLAVSQMAPVGLQPHLVLMSGVKTFLGLETVEHWQLPNIWVGPPARSLIEYGAVFAPCMRDDHELNMYYASEGYSDVQPLGCCTVPARGVAASTTESECDSFTQGVGEWTNISCSKVESNKLADVDVLKPCCFGLKTQCKLTSHKHCTFLQGQFHSSGQEHCRQVSCISQMCDMGGSVTIPSPLRQDYKPDNPSQWWRLPLALFYHNGVLHLVLVILAEFVIGNQMEPSAGWFRMVFIYFVPGVLSLMTGALFTPYSPHAGGTGIVCGLLGVLTVEISQSWGIIRMPLLELSKILIVFMILFTAGTLPYIDNFSQISGFVYGILVGIIVLPYITFGGWTVVRRRILCVLALLLIVALTYMLIYTFLYVQNIELLCPKCSYVTCIPYTPLLCNISVLW